MTCRFTVSCSAYGRTAVRITAALIVILTACGLAAGAATIHVPADQKTIQMGIDAAADGDTVLVAPGTYYENIDFKGKAITVTSSGGAAATIIDGGNKTGSATVTFAMNETRKSVISMMTIRNGGAASPDSFIEYSGGVFTYLSSPSILHNIITANHCNGVVDYESSPLIEGNTISSTIGAFAGYCLLEKGAAIEQLGGNYLATDGSVTEIRGNTIENNTDGIYGTTGGIDFFGGDGTIVQGNIIRNNTGTDAGAIAMVNMNTVSILQNLVYGNPAGGAGAFNLQPPESSVGPFTGIVAGNTIADNTVTYGKTYSGDTISSQIFISGNLAQWVFVNNVIVGNAAGTTAINCDVGYDYLILTPLVFDHNDVYAADGVSYAGACADQTGKYGNINADPRFVSPTTGNYQLSAGSPAVDTGNNSAPLLSATDLSGDKRVQDATGRGYPVVDMGVYELAGQQPLLPTTLTLTPKAYYYPGGGTNLGPFDETPVSFTVSLTSAAGIPTGPVTIYQDDSALATVNVGSTGVATYDGAGVTPGLHAFIAKYPGSGDFPPAVSVKFYLLVPLINTTVALVSNPTPSIFGQSVTFTANVTSTDTTYTPSPVTLTDTSNNNLVLATLTPNSAGVATYSTSSLSVGDHYITANYAGDSTHSAAQAQVDQQIISGYATTTMLMSSLNPANVGQSVTFTATVSSSNGVPPGVMTFSDGVTTFPAQTLMNGVATYTTSTLTAGMHPIAAAYSPTGSTFTASNGTLTETINGLASTTTLTAAPATIYYGSNVNLVAHVSSTVAGTPITGGTVTLMDGAAVIGTVNVMPDGTAAFNIATLAVGTHLLTAAYSGDAAHNASTSAAAMVVVKIDTTFVTLTSSSNPVSAFQNFTVTAQVGSSTYMPPGATGAVPPPSGKVNFTVNLPNVVEVVPAQVDASGVAAAMLSLPAGVYNVTATYLANVDFDTSTSAALSEVVTPNMTTTTLSVTPNPGVQHGTETLRATVARAPSLPPPTGAATGTVSFLDGGNVIGTSPVDVEGQATFQTNLLSVGTHVLTANYSGDVSYIASKSEAVTLLIAAQDFAMASEPSITIETEHHKDLALTLTSIGEFADSVYLSCGVMPQFASCTFSDKAAALSAGGTATSTITINTDALYNYEAKISRPVLRSLVRDGVALGLLFPLMLTMMPRRRRSLRLFLVMVAFLAIGTVTGCSGHSPGHTPPGSYSFTVTGRGATTGLVHSEIVTLVVTE